MGITPDDPMTSRALVTAYSTQNALATNQKRKPQGSIVSRQSTVPPRPSTSRLASSHSEEPYCLEQFVEEASSKPKDETVLYLAYGSNFAAEKFKGERGIKPLAQIVVQVPSLRLTFDLPGIPYAEPCFANSARRDPNDDTPSGFESHDEKTALLGGGNSRYRKDAWHKGLIGVVYEVTPSDYAHIIATEGGGAGYQDILVDCHPFASSDPKTPVPQNPTLPPFKAHTLFAPAIPDDGGSPGNGGHLQRPDPDYAQPSARYLKLITDGAAECGLPYEYQDYLLSLQPYTITTKKQAMGKLVIAMTWVPIVLMMIEVSKLFVDENGRLPAWMRKLMAMLFEAVWTTYDMVYRPVFGDGERTIDDDDGDEGRSSLRQQEFDVEKGR